MKKYMTVTTDQQTKIDRLHVLLEAQGVNTRNPKHPALYSDSALFRLLVDEKIKQFGEAANAGKQAGT